MGKYRIELDDGQLFEVEADNEPSHEEVMQAMGLSQASQPPLVTDQSYAGSALSEFARGAGSIIPNTIGGVGEISSSIVRNLNPVAWAAKAGVPGAQALVDIYAAPGEFLSKEVADPMMGKLEEMAPTNPLFADSFGQKAAGAVGQGVGFLGTMLGTSGLGATPAIARAVGLGTAGAMGAEQGGKTADIHQITDPWDRAKLVLGGAATEAITESLGGIGGGGWTRNWINRAKNATKPGSGLVRFGKTAGIEGVEEVIAGEGQDQLTKAVVEEDPNRPGFSTTGVPMPPDMLTMDNLYQRLEEGALGAIGGTVFAGAELMRGRTSVDQALGLRIEAHNRLKELQSKETLTPQEEEEFTQIQAEDQNLSTWLARQGREEIRPALDKLINDPDATEKQRTQAAEYAALIDNAEAVESSTEATPEEKAAAHDAVENHPLNDVTNRFSREGLNRTISATIDERIKALRTDVEAQSPVAQAQAAVDDLMEETAANAEASGSPETAAVIREVSQAAPTEAPAAPYVPPVRFNSRFTGTPQGPLDTREMADPQGEYVPGQILPEGYLGEGIESAVPISPETTPPNAPTATPPLPEQPSLPPPAPVQEAVPTPPVSPEQAGAAPQATGEAVPAAPASRPKPQLRRRKVPIGLSTSPREVERAVRKFAKISNVRVATAAELAGDSTLKNAWFASVPNATEQDWQTWVDSQLSTAEGLSNDGTGQAVIIPDNLVIYDTDASRAKRNLTSAGEEAMIRVLFHENWHGIERWLENTPEAKELRDRYHNLLSEISEQELDDLAQRRYPELSNWKDNPEIKRLLQSEVMAERREAAELTGEPDSLIEKFLAWLRDVYQAVTGLKQEMTPDELQELFDAWYRAQKSGVITSPVQLSQAEIPQRPQVPVTYEDRGTGNTLDEVLDSLWRPFYVSWEQGDQAIPLEQAWAEHISDPDFLFNKDVELRIEKRNAGRNWVDFTPEPSQTAPEIQASQPEMTREQREAKLRDIRAELSFATFHQEREGLDPTLATRMEREFRDSGERVKFYRKSMTDIERRDLAQQEYNLLVSLSPDGPSAEFGDKLVAYLSGASPDLYGSQGNDLSKINLINYLLNLPQDRAQIGVDGMELKRLRSQYLTEGAHTLRSAMADRIYGPLRGIERQAEELNEKAQKEEGIDPAKITKDVQDAYVEGVKAIVPDVIPMLPAIADAAQNDADTQEDLFELGIEGMDPKIVSKIRELNERVERRGKLLQMRARLLAGQQGPAASLPELPENLTLAQIDALLKEEDTAIAKLTEEITKAEKKAQAGPRKKKAKNVKVTDNASFHDYVNGKETAGIESFDKLMLKNVTSAGFNRESMRVSLTNAFKTADPDFIMGVVNRVGAMLDGAATEEGIEEDAKKAVNYDARAKRLVSKELAREAQPEVEEEESTPDPFVELTKQRLKGEISAENYRKGLQDLGVEEQTAFAMLQRVDQDRARIGDAQAQREVATQVRKDMAKAVRDSQKSDREAQIQIDQLAKQFSDTPNLKKEQATSALKDATNSFLGKEGPPISEQEFLDRLAALNVTPEKAQKLATILSESRRRDAAVRYAKASQKAQEAKSKAVEAMVKKLGKVKNPTPEKLKKRSNFVNLVAQALNSGILDEDVVNAAFAEAFDLHGLTQERIKEMGDLLQKIEGLPDGILRDGFHRQWMQILNELAPASSLAGMAFSAYMGYTLQGVGTMLMQTSNLLNYLTPLAFAHNAGRIYAATQGSQWKKLAAALNLQRNFRLTATGIREAWDNAALIPVGITGIKSGSGMGIGVNPTSLTQTPYETSLAWTAWAQWSKYRLRSSPLMRAMGVEALFKATKIPAWVASRSFNVIRGAEAWSGGVEKNMSFRFIAAAELERQGKSSSEAWRMVEEAMSAKTNAQMWQEAYKQADAEIASGAPVHKLSRKQRATELVQDSLDAKWDLELKNRHRQQSAIANFKTDPITPLGAGAYKLVSMALDPAKIGPIPNPFRFGFLFPRFFINSLETAFSYSPAALLTSLGLPTELSESKMKERQQRIVEIYGSLSNYRDARIGKSLAGTTVLAGVGAMMAAAMQMWDDDDDEPPIFWITGDLIGRWDKRGTLASNGWWAPNTMYIMGMKFNYVNSSPQFAMTLNAAGNLGDRFMFPKLLGEKLNPRTDKYEPSVAEMWIRPIGEATAAPMSRSTYRLFYDALDNAMGGDFKKLIRLTTQPVTGSATALTLGVIPSLKTFEKLEKSHTSPRSPQDIPQTLQAAVPFSNAMGLDTGKPLFSVFGEKLSPYHFFTIGSNAQEVSPQAKRAGNILIGLGIAKNPQRLEYLGDGVIEVAHDGKNYVIPPEKRDQMMKEMGESFASSIIREDAALKKMAKDKGKEAAMNRVSTLATDARKKVLSRFRPEK